MSEFLNMIGTQFDNISKKKWTQVKRRGIIKQRDF